MKIGVITTLNTNIGDNLVRSGITGLLHEVLAGENLEYVCINKHRPMSIYPAWHPCRLVDHLPVGRTVAGTVTSHIFHRISKTCFDECDILLNSGTPMMWHGCHRSAWATPLWIHSVGSRHDSVPVLNIASGSAYPWERQPQVIEDLRDADFLRKILGYCRLNIVRDSLAQQIAITLGRQAHLLPCAALLADQRNVVKKTDDYIFVNYMRLGGHYDFGQAIDAAQWQQTVKSLVNRLAKRHKLAFLCHDQAEYELCRQIDNDLPRFLPTSVADYMSLASMAKAAVCNRLHACVTLAGLGCPSVAVGTDTRLLMTANLGLPSIYVKDCTADLLESHVERQLAKASEERVRLNDLSCRTRSQYTDLISAALGRGKS